MKWGYLPDIEQTSKQFMPLCGRGAATGRNPITLYRPHSTGKLYYPAEEVLDKTPPTKHIGRRSAEVAELVDALGSGSSGRTLVEVRVFSSAPLKNQGFIPKLQG